MTSPENPNYQIGLSIYPNVLRVRAQNEGLDVVIAGLHLLCADPRITKDQREFWEFQRARMIDSSAEGSDVIFLADTPLITTIGNLVL